MACGGPLRLQNELNESFVGKTILIVRGACTFSVKAVQAQMAQAAGLIIYGCPTSAPTNCAPGLQQPFWGGALVSVPTVYMQSADGQVLAAYLRARNLQRLNGSVSVSPALFMQLISTGALVPSELAGLVEIASVSSMAQSFSGYLRPWNTQTINATTSADPCLQRVVGIWCENGHIVEVMLNGMQFGTVDGTIPSGFGALTQLRYLSLPSNQFSGAVPVELCALTLLEELYLQLQNTGNFDGLTSLPACFSQLTVLNTALLNNNALVSLPDWGSNRVLQTLDVSSNRITAWPSTFANWTQLTTFAAGSQLTHKTQHKGEEAKASEKRGQ